MNAKIKIPNLILVIVAILMPIYSIILTIVLPFKLTTTGNMILDLFVNEALLPIIITIPWWYIIYEARYRLINAMRITWNSTTMIPLRWRLFYGINAFVVLIAFVIPFISLPIAVIVGILLAGKIKQYISSLGIHGTGRKIIAAIIGLIMLVLPSIYMFYFYNAYYPVWQAIETVWNSTWVDIVYGISQCVVNALSFGSVVYFIYHGAAEYEKNMIGWEITKPPKTAIKIIEFILFIIFIYLWIDKLPTPFGVIQLGNMRYLFQIIINPISLGIVGIVFILKIISGSSATGSRKSALGIILVGAFLAVEIFNRFNILMINTIIFLSFAIFAGAFIINVIRAPRSEVYYY